MVHRLNRGVCGVKAATPGLPTRARSRRTPGYPPEPTGSGSVRSSASALVASENPVLCASAWTRPVPPNFRGLAPPLGSRFPCQPRYRSAHDPDRGQGRMLGGLPNLTLVVTMRERGKALRRVAALLTAPRATTGTPFHLDSWYRHFCMLAGRSDSLVVARRKKTRRPRFRRVAPTPPLCRRGSAGVWQTLLRSVDN